MPQQPEANISSKFNYVIIALKALVISAGIYLLILSVLLVNMEHASPPIELILMTIALVPSYFILDKVKQLITKKPSVETIELVDPKHPVTANKLKTFLNRYFLIAVPIINELILFKRIKSTREKVGEDIHEKVMRKYVNPKHFVLLKVMTFLPSALAAICMLVFIEIELPTGNSYLDFLAVQYVEGIIEILLTLCFTLFMWCYSYKLYIDTLVKLYLSSVKKELEQLKKLEQEKKRKHTLKIKQEINLES